MAVSKHCVFNEFSDNFLTHQTSKHANLKYLTKYTTKVNNKVPIILLESNIYCLEIFYQVVRWTTAESDCVLQEIRKMEYFLLQRIFNLGAPHSTGDPGSLPLLSCGKQVAASHIFLQQFVDKKKIIK